MVGLRKERLCRRASRMTFLVWDRRRASMCWIHVTVKRPLWPLLLFHRNIAVSANDHVTAGTNPFEMRPLWNWVR